MKYYIYAIHPENIEECFKRGLITVKTKHLVLRRIN